MTEHIIKNARSGNQMGFSLQSLESMARKYHLREDSYSENRKLLLFFYVSELLLVEAGVCLFVTPIALTFAIVCVCKIHNI